MRSFPCGLILAALVAVPALNPAPASAQARLTPADETAAFRAAGFKKVGRQWKSCDDSDAGSYTPGTVEQVRDINGDGLPDAVITEGSAMCYGMTGQSFWLVSKQAGGTWKLVFNEVAVPTFLPRRAAPGVSGGWPDVELGGPGFCFPVWRWNGSAYALNRFQYEGKPCRPAR